MAKKVNTGNLTTMDRLWVFDKMLSLIVDLVHQMKYFQCGGPMPDTCKY